MSEKICYACDKPIKIRYSGKFPQGVGAQTVRLTNYDEQWQEINREVVFHDYCFFKGFTEAIKNGYRNSIDWAQGLEGGK